MQMFLHTGIGQIQRERGGKEEREECWLAMRLWRGIRKSATWLMSGSLRLWESIKMTTVYRAGMQLSGRKSNFISISFCQESIWAMSTTSWFGWRICLELIQCSANLFVEPATCCLIISSYLHSHIGSSRGTRSHGPIEVAFKPKVEFLLKGKN